MLAFVGLVVPEIVRIPGTHPCYAAKTVVDAHNACAGNPPFPFLINANDFFGTENNTGPLFQVYAFCGAPASVRSASITGHLKQNPASSSGQCRLQLDSLLRSTCNRSMGGMAVRGRVHHLRAGRVVRLVAWGSRPGR